MATYLMMTGIKGVSSMKLHRDLEITQKTAWFLAHRLREAWSDKQDNLFSGPVEVDETYHWWQGEEQTRLEETV